jgi:hypothetical protein
LFALRLDGLLELPPDSFVEVRLDGLLEVSPDCLPEPAIRLVERFDVPPLAFLPVGPVDRFAELPVDGLAAALPVVRLLVEVDGLAAEGLLAERVVAPADFRVPVPRVYVVPPVPAADRVVRVLPWRLEDLVEVLLDVDLSSCCRPEAPVTSSAVIGGVRLLSASPDADWDLSVWDLSVEGALWPVPDLPVVPFSVPEPLLRFALPCDRVSAVGAEPAS